jgi:hypothetical protein
MSRLVVALLGIFLLVLVLLLLQLVRFLLLLCSSTDLHTATPQGVTIMISIM